MAAESINTIVSDEALENLKKLEEDLGKAADKMEALIPLVNNFMVAMNKATGIKETISSINNVNTATEELHQTNIKFIDTERKKQKASEEVAKTIQNEADAWNKASNALKGITKSADDLSAKLADNTTKLKENQFKIKEQRDALDRLSKSVAWGGEKIKEQDDYKENLSKITTKIQELVKEEQDTVTVLVDFDDGQFDLDPVFQIQLSKYYPLFDKVVIASVTPKLYYSASYERDKPY